MSTHDRRVEISFDRECEALRAIANVVARVRGRPLAHLAETRTSTRRSGSTRHGSQRGIAASILLPDRSPQAPPHSSAPATYANERAARYLGSLVAAFGPLDPVGEADVAWPLVDLLVLDASALTALARGNVRARLHLSRAVGSLARIVVPTTSLIDAAHARVAHAVGEVIAIDATTARDGARLILGARCVVPSTALAIAAAMHGTRAAVLTADVSAAEALASIAMRPGLYVFAL